MKIASIGFREVGGIFAADTANAGATLAVYDTGAAGQAVIRCLVLSHVAAPAVARPARVFEFVPKVDLPVHDPIANTAAKS